jgi:hypothetical protein
VRGQFVGDAIAAIASAGDGIQSVDLAPLPPSDDPLREYMVVGQNPPPGAVGQPDCPGRYVSLETVWTGPDGIPDRAATLFSVFARAQTDEERRLGDLDVVYRKTLDDSAALDFDPATLRFLGRLKDVGGRGDDRDFWIALSTDRRSITGPGEGLMPLDRLERDGGRFVAFGSGGGRYRVVGIVPDGYRRITQGGASARVDGNLVALEGATGPFAVLDGPVGVRPAHLPVRPPDEVPVFGHVLPLPALERPARPGDRLPERFRSNIIGGVSNPQPDEAAARRLDLEDGPFYLLPWGAATVLLMGPGGGGGMIRPTTDQPVRIGIVTGTPRHGSTVMGLAGPGYDTVTIGDRSAPIVDGVFRVTEVVGRGPLELIASGPAGFATDRWNL